MLVIYYLEELVGRINKHLQCVSLLLIENIRVGKHLTALDRTSKEVHGKRLVLLDLLVLIGIRC